jgi:hypothetical protein
MLPEEDKVSGRRDPASRDRCDLLREPREAERLVDMPLGILVGSNVTRCEELCI